MTVNSADSPGGAQELHAPSSMPDGTMKQTSNAQKSAPGRFPLGYRDAMSQWWTLASAPTAERNVLSLVPYLKELTAGSAADVSRAADPSGDKSDPYGPRTWTVEKVKLSGKNRELNEYSVERVGEEVDSTLVMLHGYGAGLGFFYRNFDPLSRVKGLKLYALDMLGMGNSSRPPFKVHAKDPQAKITEAENFFVDSLEEWRKLRKIDKFTLLGHSMGGYLAVSYAIKYPGHIHKLILASPVGVPEDPYAVNAAMPEPSESTVASEFTQDQEAIVTDPTNASNATEVSSNIPASVRNPGRNGIAPVAGSAPQEGKPQRRPMSSWFVWLWDANVSPFSFVRAAGPLGPRLVSGWTSRRFSHLPEQHSQALHTYAYSLFRQKGSGEYALPYILAPGAFARSPVINRIQEVGRQVVSPASDTRPEIKETGFPVVMMYGDHDWMDVAGGYACEKKLKARAASALAEAKSEEEAKRENGSVKVIVVKNAGHHLYLDNADEFNSIITKELEETRSWALNQKKET